MGLLGRRLAYMDMRNRLHDGFASICPWSLVLNLLISWRTRGVGFFDRKP